MKGTIIQKVKRIWEESKAAAGERKFLTVVIMLKEQILCRAGYSRYDYFQCDLYRLGMLGRREFLNQKRAKRIREVCNSSSKCSQFRDKSVFNEVFASFIHRDWLDLRVNNFEDFQEFTRKHEAFMIKPQFLEGGRGIHKVVISEETDLQKLYTKLKKEEALVEEIIEQCDDLKEFNPPSVNTIRVVTLLDAHDNVHIMSGVLRMGTQDNCADNFHTHGIAAAIDIETGIVVSSAINREFDRFYIHPQSHKQIIGYRVPMWKQIVETVSRAAYVVPEIRYVGWDIAVGKNNEIIMIEGNDNAARDVQQMPDLKGKWLQYKPLIEELENSKYRG